MTKQPTDNKKHSILFLLKSLNMGGVEIVTATLANKFVNEGHRVCIFSFFEPSASMRERIDERVTIYQLRKFAITAENVQALRAAMIEEGVDIVINQWGLPLVPIKVINQARKGLNIKVISVYHNDPLSNGRIQGVKTQLMHTRNCVKRVVLKLKLWVFRQVTSKAMAYIYHHSDRFMVLSPSFVRNFQQFTGVRDLSHLIVQTNPITIDTSMGKDCLSAKKKEVVFVGRIDMTQKRIDRIIEVWKLIEHKHPDWTLRIVGDGEDRDEVENLIANLGLKQVVMEGFQKPQPYYERAQILLMTSEFEGFGLVIVEGMSYGVVPIVLGSYDAINDIIHDNKDGFIMPYDKAKGFDANAMAERLDSLMKNDSMRRQMSYKAIASSERFNINSISETWNTMFNRIGGGKRKEIIYVGRLDYTQKRVHRVLETWQNLEPLFADWRLTIVGDGEERVSLEQLSHKLGLKCVEFVGFERPQLYYKRASMLMLTSEFEGFPLVLAECMSCGVVPAVYGSYSAVYDIISDGINGIVLTKGKGGYNPKLMAVRMATVMQDTTLLEQMAHEAMKTSKNYTVDTIYKQWMNVIHQLETN